MRSRIAGVIRFSYLAETGFARTPAEPAIGKAMLFDDARLRRRFHLFETLTLPSLRAQDDPDFTTVLLTSPDLPGWARERLDRAAALLPGARVLALPQKPHYQAMRAALATTLREGDTHLTSFRLDDDDALDRRFIGRIRRLSGNLMKVCDPDHPFVIGFNRGYYLQIGSDANDVYQAVEKLPVSAGLVMTAPAASPINIFRRNHRIVAQYFPTYTEADTPTFIRTIHRDNDSSAHTSGFKVDMPPEDLDRAIAGGFPFSADDLRRIGPDGLPRAPRPTPLAVVPRS